jgi:hypothetical protein
LSECGLLRCLSLRPVPMTCGGPLSERLCCKSLFAPLIANFSSCRRGFRVNMWGTSSPGDKLTGDFGNEPDATSISDRGLFRLLAGNLSPGVFRLLQHNPSKNGPTANIAVRPDSIRTGLLCSPHPAYSFFFGAPLPVWVAGRAGARPDHPILGHRPEHRRLRFGESSNQVPAALPVSGPTTAPYCPQPLDDALTVATERHPPDVILMRLGKDAPLGRQIERSVTIVITPILSGLHHCYARI